MMRAADGVPIKFNEKKLPVAAWRLRTMTIPAMEENLTSMPIKREMPRAVSPIF